MQFQEELYRKIFKIGQLRGKAAENSSLKLSLCSRLLYEIAIWFDVIEETWLRERENPDQRNHLALMQGELLQ